MEKYSIKRGKSRKVIIYDTDQVSFLHPSSGNLRKKLVLILRDANERYFRASDIWLIDKGIKPLYYNGISIRCSDSLWQLLNFLHVNSVEELIGKQIYTAPDKRNFLVPVCFDPLVIATKSPLLGMLYDIRAGLSVNTSEKYRNY